MPRARRPRHLRFAVRLQQAEGTLDHAIPHPWTLLRLGPCHQLLVLPTLLWHASSARRAMVLEACQLARTWPLRLPQAELAEQPPLLRFLGVRQQPRLRSRELLPEHAVRSSDPAGAPWPRFGGCKSGRCAQSQQCAPARTHIRELGGPCSRTRAAQLLSDASCSISAAGTRSPHLGSGEIRQQPSYRPALAALAPHWQ